MTDPLIGWRVWKIVRPCLRSWAVDYIYTPGENTATCLRGVSCASPPGPGCACGFWAVWDPWGAVGRAEVEHEPPWEVIGLIEGYGSVALHGDEGFRAQHARVKCLFTDRLWKQQSLSLAGLGPLESPFSELSATYGVPCISLAVAIDSGFLAELGIPGNQIEQAKKLVQMRAAA